MRMKFLDKEEIMLPPKIVVVMITLKKISRIRKETILNASFFKNFTQKLACQVKIKIKQINFNKNRNLPLSKHGFNERSFKFRNMIVSC